MAIVAFLNKIVCHTTTGGIGDDEMAAYFSVTDGINPRETHKIYEEDMGSSEINSVTFSNEEPGPYNFQHGLFLYHTLENSITIKTMGVEIDGRDSNIEEEFQDFLASTTEFDQDNFLWFNTIIVTEETLSRLTTDLTLPIEEYLQTERIFGGPTDTGAATSDIEMDFDTRVQLIEDNSHRIVEHDTWTLNHEESSRYSVIFRFAYLPNVY